MEKETSKIFKPCCHKCVCDECAQKIEESGLECPMCRQAILSIIVDGVVVAEIKKSDWENFQRVKDRYVSRFSTRSNAMYKGKSAQAKAVSKRACSELDALYNANRAGDICMLSHKKKKTEERDGRLYVTYKLGRTETKEDYPLSDIPEDLEQKDDLELITHYPDIYWLKFHKKRKKDA